MLLCRLYEPSAGRITVDGIELATLDAAGWRRRLAAAFQDATRFELTAATNVEFGRVDAVGDRAGVEAAGASAGVADTIAGLPLGWDTPLSSQYAGGVDLSGGEWQKVALARATAALREVSLRLPAGAVVAVVGENGAGKTTMVKLLCGLYAPTGGRILIDGVDLASVDVDAYRQCIAAGFQDFMRFELVAREAVGVGELRRMPDVNAVRTALRKARARTPAASPC